MAADCLKRLRQVNRELGGGGYLARATITLQLKGLAVFDERSKVGVVKWVWLLYQNSIPTWMNSSLVPRLPSPPHTHTHTHTHIAVNFWHGSGDHRTTVDTRLSKYYQ